jgi:hypothetical protein
VRKETMVLKRSGRCVKQGGKGCPREMDNRVKKQQTEKGEACKNSEVCWKEDKGAVQNFVRSKRAVC